MQRLTSLKFFLQNLQHFFGDAKLLFIIKEKRVRFPSHFLMTLEINMNFVIHIIIGELKCVNVFIPRVVDILCICNNHQDKKNIVFVKQLLKRIQISTLLENA